MNSDAAERQILARKIVTRRLKRLVDDALARFTKNPDDLWRSVEARATVRLQGQRQ